MADYRDHDGEERARLADQARGKALGLSDEEQALCRKMRWTYENYREMREVLTAKPGTAHILPAEPGTDPDPPEGCTCRSYFARTGRHSAGCNIVPRATEPVEKGLRIMSDGTPHGTKVFFNGEPITRVKSISWSICDDELAKVTMEISGVPVTVNAVTPPEVLVRCAGCNEWVGDHTCGEPTI
jgi:hypothetical protein